MRDGAHAREPSARPGGLSLRTSGPLDTQSLDADYLIMTAQSRFTAPELAMLRQARILGVRAGAEHRYTGVWTVVVEDRVFVRSWNDKPTGWYRAFRTSRRGAISVGKTEIAVVARPVRSDRIRHAVSQAYADKYTTKASAQWVAGFAEPHREATTLELVPGRSASPGGHGG